MNKLDITFISRSSVVDASRVGTLVTWQCPVANIAPLSGKGIAYTRRAGNLSESILYPHYLTTTLMIKKLQHDAEDADYDYALAWEFFESTCAHREKFAIDCSVVRGIKKVLTLCEQQSNDWSIKPVSHIFMESEFTLRVPPSDS